MNNKFKNYLEDCLMVLIERSIEARENTESTESDFDKGRSFGYYKVLEFLLNQAEIFDIKEDLKERIKTFIPSF
jgi:hypothetical protein